MSIFKTSLSDIKQTFDVCKEDKLHYGEIYSPFELINKIFNLFEDDVFTEPNKKWLDVGAGTGYFSIMLFYRLDKGLMNVIPNETERKIHIIQNMIYMVEIKESNILELKKTFGEKSNVIHNDFINGVDHYIKNNTFDYIIGNPPYNSNGIKKVPTNKALSKKNEGNTVWCKFIVKSLTLLKKDTGKLAVIIPSIWLKRDKGGMHNILTYYKLEKIHCLNSNQTNVTFNGNAQTPTCFFILTKKQTDGIVSLYDINKKEYILYKHTIGESIPLFGSYIINKLKKWINMKDVGYLKVVKTNMPSVHSKFIENLYDPNYPYTNVKTCLLEKNTLQPTLTMNYSNIPQSFYGVKKIIMAHKMYGFPYYDNKGQYGISNRDNYIIIDKTDDEFKQLQKFLSSKLVLYIFESSRYRMRYLEKYAFEFIPDITKIHTFPSFNDINEKTINDFFELDEADIMHINNLHKREYKMFI